MTARRATSSIAGILEALELRQSAVVTDDSLARAISEAGSRLNPKTAAERLVREGWLAPVRTRHSWEFLPASRAGPYRSGDPWIELRAVLAHRSDVPVAIAFESAVWELGYSGHQPTAPVLAHRRGWRPPLALSDIRSITYEWRLPASDKGGLPIWQPATVAVAAAERPGAQGDWANADTWLPETMRATTPDQILTEAAGRGIATMARLGYLAEWSHRYDIADLIEGTLPDVLPVSYLGPRRPRGRWINRWRLYDALLPER